MKHYGKIFVFAIMTAAAVWGAGCSGSANDVGTFLQMSIREAQAGKDSNALMLAKEACMVSPDNVEALIMRALMAERCNDKTLALDSALQAVRLAPDNFAALYTVGRLYSCNKDTAAEAAGYLEKAHKIKEDDINTLILLANLSVFLKSDKALGYLLKIESLDSSIIDTFEGKTMLGHAYMLRGDKRRATINFGFADKRAKSVLSNYNYAVAIDCLYNKPALAASKYQVFLKQSADDPAFASLRKNVEKRVRKIKPARSRRR